MAKLVRATQYSVAVDSCTSQRNVVFSPVLSVSLGILSSSEPTYTVPPSLPPSPFSSFRLPDGTRAGAYPNTTRQQKQRRGGVSAPPPFRPARVNVPNFFLPAEVKVQRALRSHHLPVLGPEARGRSCDTGP